jgi:hypothetical protein
LTEGDIYYGQRGSGQIIHEFLHTVGYPDLYCDSDGVPVGKWDIMAADTYAVQYPLAYLRSAYTNWFSMDTVKESAEGVSLYAASAATDATKDKQALILKTDYSDTEFFVVEYRKQSEQYSGGVYNEGYDSRIPGSGLIIYRVNKAYQSNHDGKPQWMIYVFQPEDTWDSDKNCENARGDHTKAYLSAEAGRTSYGSSDFTKSLADGAITYSDGRNSGIVISNVGSASGDQITFDITFTEPEEETWKTAAEKTDDIETTEAASCMDTDGNLYYIMKEGSSTISFYQCSRSSFTKLGSAPAGSSHLLTCYNGAVYTAYVNSSYKPVLARWNGSSWQTLYTSSVASNENQISLTSDSQGVYLAYADQEGTSICAVAYNGTTATSMGNQVCTSTKYASNPSVASENGKVAVMYREAYNSNQICVKLYDSTTQTWNTIGSQTLQANNGIIAIHDQKLYLMKNGTTFGNNTAYLYVCDLSEASPEFRQMGEDAYADVSISDKDIAFVNGEPYLVYMTAASPYSVEVRYLQDNQWKSLGDTVVSGASGGLGMYYYENDIYVTYLSSISNNVVVKKHSAGSSGSESGGGTEDNGGDNGGESGSGSEGGSNGDDTVAKYGDVLKEDIPEGGSIPEGLWIAGIQEDGYTYTGSAVKPEVRVYDYKTLLKEKTDYTISYKNNTKANNADNAKTAPTITVTGKGNYADKETVTFSIKAPSLSDSSFAADDMAIAANGKEQKPVPELYWNGKKLKNKTDYTVTYYDNEGRTKLDSVKDAGDYQIRLEGAGNFTGTRDIHLEVIGAQDTSRKLVSKVSVSKIKAQAYTGAEIKPPLTVKSGKITLTESKDGQDGDYTVAYENNIGVGTAYAVITGKGDYSGTKRVSFKINAKAGVNRAKVSGLDKLDLTYDGTEKTPQLTLSVNEKLLKADTGNVEDADYTVTWQKNKDAGTATVIFTGKGGYNGTLKKTFKIKAFNISSATTAGSSASLETSGGTFKAVIENNETAYAKGGAKPELTVTFTKADGTEQTLKEGTDYTLAYKNNKAVSDAKKAPTVTIKGKGNFTGSTSLTYKVVQQDIGKLMLTAADKTYQNKKNIYATKLTVTDLDGKVLRAGTDYDNKNVAYTYAKDTTLEDAAKTVKKAGTPVGKDDIIPAGTEITVTVTGKGNYTGTLPDTYRITKSSISGARVTINKQTYTGETVTLDKEQITVKVKNDTLTFGQDYEIVANSYKNNVKKGTATVTIKGLGDYGGTKTVKFTIQAKGFKWWQQK